MELRHWQSCASDANSSLLMVTQPMRLAMEVSWTMLWRLPKKSELSDQKAVVVDCERNRSGLQREVHRECHPFRQEMKRCCARSASTHIRAVGSACGGFSCSMRISLTWNRWGDVHGVARDRWSPARPSSLEARERGRMPHVAEVAAMDPHPERRGTTMKVLIGGGSLLLYGRQCASVTMTLTHAEKVLQHLPETWPYGLG